MEFEKKLEKAALERILEKSEVNQLQGTCNKLYVRDIREYDISGHPSLVVVDTTEQHNKEKHTTREDLYMVLLGEYSDSSLLKSVQSISYSGMPQEYMKIKDRVLEPGLTRILYIIGDAELEKEYATNELGIVEVLT